MSLKKFKQFVVRVFYAKATPFVLAALLITSFLYQQYETTVRINNAAAEGIAVDGVLYPSKLPKWFNTTDATHTFEAAFITRRNFDSTCKEGTQVESSIIVRDNRFFLCLRVPKADAPKETRHFIVVNDGDDIPNNAKSIAGCLGANGYLFFVYEYTPQSSN